MASQRPVLPANPPPGGAEAKWKAKAAINRLGLNGAESSVMWCLIDCANGRTGLCYPGQEFMAGLLGLRPLTVKRAIASLKKRRLIKVIRCGSNRYYINWPMFFSAFDAMEAFRKKRSKVIPERPTRYQM